MKKKMTVLCGVFCLAVFLMSAAASARAALPECVDHGQTCIIGGTPCCDSGDSCSGKFPNTTCQ